MFETRLRLEQEWFSCTRVKTVLFDIGWCSARTFWWYLLLQGKVDIVKKFINALTYVA